jgi:hypothetical protein
VRPGSTFEFRTTAKKKFKTEACDWKGDSTNLSVLGSSSRGHVAELVADAPERSALSRDSDARSG